MQEQKRVLLVIDDEEEFCAMMKRALRRHFDEVLSATCADAAVSLLESEPITHVVCDLYLGEGQPLGHDLICGWRARKPSIRYVALFTGSSLGTVAVGTGIPDVDGVFKKPSGLTELFAKLKDEAS